MDKVQECHITNEQVRHWFMNIPPLTISSQGECGTTRGKAYQMSDESQKSEILSAWIHTPKKPGRPKALCRNNFIYSLRRIMLDKINEEGSFKDWVKYAKNKSTWDDLIEDFFGSHEIFYVTTISCGV